MSQEERLASENAANDDNFVENVDDPLRHLRRDDELPQIAREFAHRVDKFTPVDERSQSPHESLFNTAVQIAYDAQSWETVCNELERRTLSKGMKTSFLSQTRDLRATVLCLCLSALIQGFVQSTLNGSNQTLPKTFHLTNDENVFVDKKSLWIYAGLNGSVYLTAGLCGCFLADPLQSAYLGRRGAVLIAASICFAASIAGAFSTSWQHLMVARAFLGLGLGAKASVTPLFCAEIFDALGIFLGFSVSLALAPTEQISWKLQTAAASIPTALLILLIWNVPESPRWLLKKGKYPEAFESMCALRHSPLEAATELFFANEQLQTEAVLMARSTRSLERPVNDRGGYQADVKRTNYWKRFLQLFRHPSTRRALIAASVAMIGQQLCGINILAFYGTTFFRDARGPSSVPVSRLALWISFGIGLTNFLFGLLAYLWIDRRGRRWLLLATYPGMALCMLAACFSSLRDNDQTRFILVCIFMFLFVVLYSVGQGPVAFAYASEVFPLINREAGMSFSVFVNLTAAGLLTTFVALAQPVAGEQLDGTIASSTEHSWQLLQTQLLGCFTALNVISYGLIFFFVPETKGATVDPGEGRLNYLLLEEIRDIFETSVKERFNEGLSTISGLLKLLFTPQLDQRAPTLPLQDGYELDKRNDGFDHSARGLGPAEQDRQESGGSSESLHPPDASQIDESERMGVRSLDDEPVGEPNNGNGPYNEALRDQWEPHADGTALNRRLVELFEEAIPLLRQHQFDHR